MSLATRCTACGTIFRVVQDQLRVSEGWVRCGRCAEVFDAREQLFDIDREAPPPWPATAPDIEVPAEPELAHQPEAVEVQAAARRDEDVTWAMPRDDTVVRADTNIDGPLESGIDVEFEPEPPPAAASEAAHQAGRREPYWVDGDAPAQEPLSSVDAHPAPMSSLAEANASPLADSTSTPNSEPETPPATSASFLRQAELASRWQRPRVRAALAALTLLLGGLLGAQLTWQFRDALQALFPQATPLLQAFCAAAGCELKPWHRIDALTVENSALTVAGNGNNYKLRINLHNKAAYAVALPWVDLSLTDGNGALVARRMLPPSDFNLSASGSLGAHAEETLQIVFSTGAQRVSGYSIEIFHP